MNTIEIECYSCEGGHTSEGVDLPDEQIRLLRWNVTEQTKTRMITDPYCPPARALSSNDPPIVVEGDHKLPTDK